MRLEKLTAMVRILFEDLISSLSALGELLVFILGQEISEEFLVLCSEDWWWHLVMCATLKTLKLKATQRGYMCGSGTKL